MQNNIIIGILSIIWLSTVTINYFLYGFSYTSVLYNNRSTDLHFIFFWNKIISNVKVRFFYRLVLSIIWTIFVSLPKYIIDFLFNEPITENFKLFSKNIIILHMLIIPFAYFTIVQVILNKNNKIYNIIKKDL